MAPGCRRNSKMNHGEKRNNRNKRKTDPMASSKSSSSSLSESDSAYSISLPIERLSVLTSDLMTLARVCLAVISIVVLVTMPQSAYGQQQLNRHSSQMDSPLMAGSNNQLMPHHHHSAAHNSAAMFKDLSGPTSGKIQTLDVICGKNYMTVRAEFSAPFYGIVFSKGTYGHENCIYVKPNSGMTHAAFNVYYDQCGTKPDLQGKFYENTIVIQYGSDIIEAYDEAKRLRCEWFEAYEKPATFKPAIPVADLEVVEMNFQGDDIDCWMEIQEGTGPWSKEVSKIVPVGQPMTIVVVINDYNGQFDMRVKSCVAHDGVQQPISLTDEFGCVLRPKMLTPFIKVKNPPGHKKATVLSYSRFLAFKFPDSMNVQIQCTVEVCRHGCADACQRVPSMAATTIQPELSLTAKWPSAPNQPAIEGPRRPISQGDPLTSDSMVHSESRPRTPAPQVPQFLPARVQFGPRQTSHGLRVDQSSGDELRASDSSRQPQLADAQLMYHHSHGGQRRAPHEPAHGMRRRPLGDQYANSLPANLVSSSTTSTTTTTQLPPTMRSSSGDDSRVGQPNEPETTMDMAASTEDQQPGVKLSDDMPNVAASDASQSQPEQPDQKSDASRVKEVAVSSPNSESNQDNLSSMQQPAAESGPSAESVAQGGQATSNSQVPPQTSLDKERPNSSSDEQASYDTGKQSPMNQEQGSSLKTVEVEVPANEEPMRTLIASSVPSSSNGEDSIGYQGSTFNSNRLSNGGNDFNQQANYLNRQLQDAASHQDSPSGGYKIEANGESAMQPRESQTIERRHKPDESNIETMISKSRFGARSQPQAAVNQAAESAQSSYNEQSGASAGVDRVLIDRSDESSPAVDEASPSVGAQSEARPTVGQDRPIEGASKVAESVASDLGVDESSPAMSVDSSSLGAKTKPVVGTEELASGPLQIEDRIGAPAATGSLEDAIMRLQEQVPQTAALISGQDSKPKIEERSDKDDGAQSIDATVRSDRNPEPMMPHPMDRTEPQQQLQRHSPGQSNQPFPNVNGQVKVIPDPNAGLNGKSPMMTQASSHETISQNAPVLGSQVPTESHQLQMAKSAIETKQQEHNKMLMQMQQGKPVAQITNVPINIGFPQNQIPSIQQMNQQMAMFAQQQQQQQQQQQKAPTTAKPSRGRFSLLSPQAAIQAVASRFMPKSNSQQQNPRPNQPQVPGISLPLSPEQQSMMQQEHVARYLASQQNPQPGRFVQPNVPAHPQSSGLFGRLSSAVSHLSPLQQTQARPQQQVGQPLVRSRRSAIQPKGKKGNGELGLTRSFMVVTGLDLAFMPNSSDIQLPPILEGHKMGANLDSDDGEVIYGVCMPVVSLTFVLTCAFWLLAFIFSFCIYMLMKQRQQQKMADAKGQKG